MVSGMTVVSLPCFFDLIKGSLFVSREMCVLFVFTNRQLWDAPAGLETRGRKARDGATCG